MKKRLDKEVKICYNKSRCENNYCNLTVFEPLAQAAEHLPFKQGVPGSIPGWLTIIPLAMRIYAVAKGIFCISVYVILAMIIGRVSRNSAIIRKENQKNFPTKLDNRTDIV